MKILDFNYMTDKLLRWYPENRRELPWRDTKDPYIIWLSEIILQQTRVAQGLPYFKIFFQKFPTVRDLAAASEEEIMRTWQGLGYYSRARNLHQCAKDIVAIYDGNFPTTYPELLKLKGIGSYTAAAIASFAFREKVAVVDGNVFRVLARFYGVYEDISSTIGKKTFQDLANTLIPENEPDTFNQAIMEFGALQCVPKNPDCGNCPLSKKCFAYHKDAVTALPVKNKKVKVTERFFLYLHIKCDGQTVINKRDGKDIWKGLVDFPLQEMDSLNALENGNPENLSGIEKFRELGAVFEPGDESPVKHVLTHQRIFASFVKIQVPGSHIEALKTWANSRRFELVADEKLEDLGKPILIERYLNR